jgi:hypothetical protein
MSDHFPFRRIIGRWVIPVSFLGGLIGIGASLQQCVFNTVPQGPDVLERWRSTNKALPAPAPAPATAAAPPPAVKQPDKRNLTTGALGPSRAPLPCFNEAREIVDMIWRPGESAGIISAPF